MRISAIISRFGISLLAFLVYSILLLCYFAFIEHMDHAAIFIIFIYISFYIGWKGLLILPIVSFILDEFVLIKLKRALNIPNKVSVIIGFIIYLFLGWILVKAIYGDDHFIMQSGLITTVIYYALCQAVYGIIQYQRLKIVRIHSEEEAEGN
jgi:hypothetical protein